MQDQSKRVLVDLDAQTLALYQGDRVLAVYPVSTGKNGAGELSGSGCTPRGLHRIRIRIGEGQPEGTVFRGRRPTGEVYGPELAAAEPDRDWILTRVLWLTGCEPGLNRGGCVDTLRRYIYIHGCPDTEPMGVPRSHGCIRMRNRDLIALFDAVPKGTLVDIRGGGAQTQGDDSLPGLADA
ncbi:MAG: L,D-transpeptidase [Chromatiaceae bacterium]